MPKKILILAILFLLALGVWLVQRPEPNDSTPNPAPQEQTKIVDGGSKQKYSLYEPSSIWVIVNKLNPLPDGFKPDDLFVPAVRLRLGNNHEQMQLRREAGLALKQMFDDAKIEGLNLMLGSGFRSWGLQKTFYDGYVATDGREVADTYSARPGHSEHQTGLVVDIDKSDQACHLEECFGELPEGKWLAENAYKYGFIMRYPKGKQHITGYIYEPWHFRYVGKELALEMKNKNILTLEEFFDLPNAGTYQDAQ